MSILSKKNTPYRALEAVGANLLKSDCISRNYGYAYWQNDSSEVSYQQNEVHTLSLYLNGGDRTTRSDCKMGYGYKGAICLLPQHCDSSWLVKGRIELFHFYFSDEAVRRYIAKTHDIEPSVFEIPEIVFSDDDALKRVTHNIIIAMNTDAHMDKEVRISEYYETLLKNRLISRRRKITGGLSPSDNNKLKAYIDHYHTENISLHELSNLVGLSEYHVQKMFKRSNGISPSEYLAEVRVNKVRALLGKKPLSQISLECGFSHQSHMHRVFKHHVGITPLRYLKEQAR